MEVRRIIHIDMDAFYAAVEQHDRPELRGLPIVVGGSETRRGVVMTASYEARRFGVRSAMPTAQAFRLCPDLIRVDGRMGRYKEVSAQVRRICEAFTDQIEPLSLDESFLDVTGHCEQTGEKAGRVARRLKAAILAETGLTASAGVGPSKLVAKIGSDLRKPDGLVIIAPDQVSDFLRPLPIERLWGVGPVTGARLRALGLSTLGDLADRSTDWVESTLGEGGRHLQAMAQGVDTRPVQAHGDPRSVSAENTFAVDVQSVVEAEAALDELAEEVAHRLVRSGFRAHTVVLKLRYSDFTTISRSQSLSKSVDQAADIIAESRRLLRRTEFPQRAVRLLGIGVSNLISASAPHQLELWR